LGTRGYFGSPILRKSLFWDGNGEVATLGGDVFSHWFLTDSFALGAGLGGTVFQTPGDNALGTEAQASARWYPYASESFGVFVDGTLGYLRTTREVPPEGTRWNYTFSFGPGIDVPMGNDMHLLVGGSYHHISNAMGRQSQRNPSQNEARLWLGLEWTW
jgi:hypothetical protein